MNRRSLDATTTAQRVLAALAEGRDPDAQDVDKLRRIAPPLADRPPEELARQVILLAESISGSQELSPRSSRRQKKQIGPVSPPELP
jgi:hypothetical protein